MNDTITKKLYFAVPILILLFSFYCIFNNYLWADETFSLVVIKKSYLDMLFNLSLDVHPPIYYFILKFGSYLICPLFGGNIIYSAKFITFLPLILLVITGFTIVREMFGELVSFMFNIFIISMPEMLVFAVEIRMYSYAILFVTLSFLYAIKIMRNNNKIDWIMFTIFTILSTYTHYFSTIASIFIYFILMMYSLLKDHKLIKRFFVSALIVVISFLPWVFLQITKLIQGGMMENFWITKPTFLDIISFIKFPFSVMKYHSISYILIILTTIIGIYMLLYVFKKSKDREYYEALYGISIIILVTILGTIISLYIKPVFVRRYMVPGLGCFWLGIAIIIKKISNTKNLQKLIVSIYLLCGLLVIFERIQIETNYNFEVKKMNNILNDNLTKDTVIITNKQTIQQTLTYYYPTTKIYQLGHYNLSLIYDNTFDTNFVKNINSLDEIKDIDLKNYIFASSSDEFFKNYGIDMNTLKEIGSYYLDNAGEVVFYKYK